LARGEEKENFLNFALHGKITCGAQENCEHCANIPSDGCRSAFSGFEGDVATAILADMLLCFCLENARHALGREEQVQRVAPTHYMASWVDLPESVGHLRYVPEMIVAMLANQTASTSKGTKKMTGDMVCGRKRVQDNVLLKAFDAGVIPGEILGSLSSDRFDEHQLVGLDQLLTVRLAQQLELRPISFGCGRREDLQSAANLAKGGTRFLGGYATFCEGFRGNHSTPCLRRNT